eukprot:2460340-Amphidinium_carterae.1
MSGHSCINHFGLGHCQVTNEQSTLLGIPISNSYDFAVKHCDNSLSFQGFGPSNVHSSRRLCVQRIPCVSATSDHALRTMRANSSTPANGDCTEKAVSPIKDASNLA